MSPLYVAAIVTGIASGGLAGLIAVGVTQIYRVTRILNFADAGFAMWGAYLYSVLTTDVHLPVILGVLVTLIAIAAMGVGGQLLVFRFAHRASTANKIILTFGLFTVLSSLALAVFGLNPYVATALVQDGAGLPLLGTRVAWYQVAEFCSILVALLGFWWFLRFTRLGLLSRACAEDQQLASLHGINELWIGALNWALGAVTAGVAGIFIASSGPFTSDVFFTIFLTALLATMAGGFRSLPLAALGAVVLSVTTSVVDVSSFQWGPQCIFLAVVVLALAKRSWFGEIRNLRIGGSLVGDEARYWSVTIGAWIVIIGAAIAVVVSAWSSILWASTASLILIFGVVGLSLVPVIGWTGQVSLATAGVMGIGGFATVGGVDYYHLPLPVGLLLGVAVGTLAGLVVGVIVHRLSFALTVIVTLSFSGIASFFDGGKYAPWNPHFASTLQLPSYLASPLRLLGGLGVLALLAFAMLGMVARSPWKTRLLAVKTSPVMASHFGVRPWLARIYAHGLSGAVAGLAGAMYSLLLVLVSPYDFGPVLSLQQVLLLAVFGGTTALWGPFVGALIFEGLPTALSLNRYGSSFFPTLLQGVIVVIMMAVSLDGVVGLIRRPSEPLSAPNSPRRYRPRIDMTSEH